MNKSFIQKCRKCGRPVSVITWGIYRKVLVDAEAVDVFADAEGEQFVRIDGSKVKGFEAEIPCEGPTEPAYRPHRCGGKA